MNFVFVCIFLVGCAITESDILVIVIVKMSEVILSCRIAEENVITKWF